MYKLDALVVHEQWDTDKGLRVLQDSRGHYTSIVRQPDDSWLHLDGQRRKVMEPSEVQKSAAYVLSYSKLE